MKAKTIPDSSAETRSSLVGFLNRIEAGNTSHSGRSLMDHLLGTYDLLNSWGCDKTTCLAGGLHSVYGTNIFTKATINGDARSLVCQEFGNEVERLAWLFGAINRPKAIEIGYGINRRNNDEITIDTDDLHSLRLIEAANLLEQGSTLDKWPNIQREATDQIRPKN